MYRAAAGGLSITASTGIDYRHRLRKPDDREGRRNRGKRV